MHQLTDYKIIKEISKSSNSLVYRAFDEKNNRPVILKILNKQHPTAEDVSTFFREYELLNLFKNEGIISVYDKSTSEDAPLIVMEDIEGETLKSLLKSMKLSLEEFLKLAIDITGIIENIHKRNIIHKDINPSNIIWNIEKETVRIIDLGIATELPREITSVKNPNILEGTIAYISPEQTGRMNRSLDYRTDFYSLGVTFYWILTGRLPFETEDLLKLVHSHIAVEPECPHDIDESIPKPVCDIVMKLMAKNAEDRYLSAHGLKADLKYCIEELQKNRIINPFEPGLSDVSDKFEISQKLYGREEETDTLMKAFDRVSEGSTEIMLVSGFGGIGKSVLINEIQRPILKHRSYFFGGKFEQLKRDVPYSAITRAFSGLARQILGEKESEIFLWKEKITKALGPNGKIVTDIFPLFELIIGKQPEVPVLGSAESQNRFNIVLQEFIKTLADKEHPLVMFIDDLQWADSASLHLLKLFAADSDTQYFLIIGAYRHNETPDSHPLMLTLDEIKKSGSVINNIFLNPLTVENINQLLCDTLNCQREESKSLAGVLIEKTGGNPFFVNEFIKSLYAKSLIEFSFEDGWSWNMAGITEMQATDNVVELIAEQITDLPVESQEMIKLSACLGNSFELETLVTVSEKSHEYIEAALKKTMQKGMLNLIDESYQFSHDRVLEAAYSLISDEEKARQHYLIGNLVLNSTDTEHLEEKIFYIVNQLNAGAVLVSKDSEKRKLTELNLLAGKKALASNAYTSALNYLKAGIELLKDDSWKEDYHLTLEFYQEAAIAADLIGSFDEMDRLANAVYMNAETILDTIKISDMLIFSLNGRNQVSESIKTGLRVLRKLGVRLPAKPGILRVIYAIISVKFLMRGKSFEKLIELPKMEDPHKLAIMNIMPGVGSAAYTTLPEMMPLIMSDTIRLSIKYGNCSYSPFAFAGLGMIHCSVLGEIDRGYEYGSFSLKLIEKLGYNENKTNAMFVFWCFINHWKNPIRDSLLPFLEIYKTGLEAGDFLFAAVAVNAYSCYLIYGGVELETVEKEMVIYTEAIRKLNQTLILSIQHIQHQVVLNLQGKNDDPCSLIGSIYNIDTMLPRHEEQKDFSSLFAALYFSFYLHYTFEKFTEALRHSESCKTYIDSVTSTPYIPLLNFYDSLVRLALYPEEKRSKQKNYLKIVQRNQKKMKKWASHSPSNCSHKYHLVEAEIARIMGEEVKARKHYDDAVKLAHENKFLHEEALALELAGKFWLDLNEEKMSAVYLTESLNVYRKWGANAKVDHLKNKYRDMFDRFEDRSLSSSTTTSTNTTSSTDSIDLSTVIKTSQTLSSEIDLYKLLTEVMRLSIENAGAQRGFLILENEEDGKLYIEAEGDGSKNISVLQTIPVEGNSSLSPAVIRFVNRTSESIVLNNAHTEGDFTDDPYIKENKTKSLLCTPVTHKGKKSGILYLENNLTSNVFTPDRIELLQLISSQAAISIENAQLLIEREKALDIQTKMTNAFARFVPIEFLTFLNKKCIVEVELGNQVQKQMTVLFSDIRSFASLSEKMTPQENFNFLNSYLKRTGPVIRSNGGFIDKYIGDAIMALFPHSSEDAVDAALLMQASIAEYNKYRKASGYDSIEIGIGIHYGNLMLGTIGEENRMEGTVISDDVNLSSRIESLTKYYKADILVSGTLLDQLRDREKYTYRIIDTVIVKGRSEPVTLIEILDKETSKNFTLKVSTKDRLIKALQLYRDKSISEALEVFKELSIESQSADNVFEIYIERCKRLLADGIPDNWNGVEKLENK